MSAWRIAGILHAMEGWGVHECGNMMFDIEQIWRASLEHGFRPLMNVADFKPNSHLPAGQWFGHSTYRIIIWIFHVYWYSCLCSKSYLILRLNDFRRSSDLWCLHGKIHVKISPPSTTWIIMSTEALQSGRPNWVFHVQFSTPIPCKTEQEYTVIQFHTLNPKGKYQKLHSEWKDRNFSRYVCKATGKIIIEQK